MKKNQVDAILINQTKRRNKVFAFVCIIIIFFILSLSFFLIYFKKNQVQYVKYDETSNIDYKVLLKENNFFDNNYLTANKKYIASLIDYITADFNYKLSLEEKDIEYKYSYRIESTIDVKEVDSDISLFNKVEKILDTQERQTTSKSMSINEHIDIDYNKYNDLIKDFIAVYDLDDIESTLTINMYISVLGSCEDFEKNQMQESVISLSIPLTTKTVAIDIGNDLINSENNVMQCKSPNSSYFFLLSIGIVFAFIDLLLIIYTIRYEIKTRTAENIYEKELKKILNNYSSYIQTLDSEFDFSDYQLLKVNTFTDMLEIRDTIRQPILLKENKEKTGAYFVIPSNTKVLYVYRLKVSDIEKEIQKKL